jgi:spore cortex formation protein SpoVR/YcgB (stage V sporulation)
MQETASMKRKILTRETDGLTNIDGFMVTNGQTSRITFSSRLSEHEKSKGKEQLLNQFNNRKEPGVYLWNAPQRRR